MFDGCSDWNLCGQKAHTPLNKALTAIQRFPYALWKTSVLLDFCLLSIFPALFFPGFIITDIWRENKFCFCSPKLYPGGVKSAPPSPDLFSWQEFWQRWVQRRWGQDTDGNAVMVEGPGPACVKPMMLSCPKAAGPVPKMSA